MNGFPRPARRRHPAHPPLGYALLLRLVANGASAAECLVGLLYCPGLFCAPHLSPTCDIMTTATAATASTKGRRYVGLAALGLEGAKYGPYQLLLLVPPSSASLSLIYGYMEQQPGTRHLQFI